jgi:FG-GAP-like repeat
MLLQRLLVPVFALLPATVAAQAAYTEAPAQIPATGSFTENVDFADVDHDGDMDAILADGGDAQQDQNRIYINSGGLQGGTVGFFVDETAARMPVQNTDGRDIEFADIDQDGDFDIYTSNTAQLLNQGNHWWIDVGGSGIYRDETLTRWVGLGGAGSSIPPSAVLAGNTFIDWSCDCDFGDMDNDGDLDLFHSTYGGAFGGQVPTRLFLNNGGGFYSEFNPSGFQLSTTNIANGNPGLWCQGTQAANTTNVSGSNCDIAATPLDLDVLDADGDFDLDILHGARNEAPRYFKNLLQESGSVAWRDVTGTALPGGLSTGGNYEQEQGDMDNDGDWDLYGLNWGGLTDLVFNNASTTTAILYNNLTVLPTSGNDDNEGDFVDYDNDGDMDLFIAAFASTNRLYRNDYAGGAPGSFSYTFVTNSGLTSSRALDSDVADIDNDGDYDDMTAEDAGQNERLYVNILNPGDNKAAQIAKTEQIASGAASTTARIARATIKDSGNYYTTWYNATNVNVTVDGFALPAIKAITSQGNLFRASVPGNLFGSIGYNWSSKDEHGNTGVSASKNYTSTGGPVGTLYGASVPGANGPLTIQALSVPFPGTSLYLGAGGGTQGVAIFLAFSDAATVTPIDLGSGLVANIAFPSIELRRVFADAAGHGVASFAVPSTAAGTTVYLQAFSLAAASGNTFASSQGLTVTIP